MSASPTNAIQNWPDQPNPADVLMPCCTRQTLMVGPRSEELLPRNPAPARLGGDVNRQSLWEDQDVRLGIG